uniref:Small ribosomal subunit protein uS8c n=1 Tax=Chloroparvula japonica TaxID=1411623 RepID=A0A4D6C315_9CHLO|nr:ribosomal protein S8 [Chloroparvula japonica]QBX98156.1 ribosomal protein S8 [Chloroparvula japonica]
MAKQKSPRHRRAVTSDAVADMMAQIQNGLLARRHSISINRTRVTTQVANLLLREGFIEAIVSPAPTSNVFALVLKYKANGAPAITGLQRISHPGLRVYVGAKELPRVLDGMGLVLLSTPLGVLNNYQARSSGVGGEVLGCFW